MDMNFNSLPSDWKDQPGEQPSFSMDQLTSKSPQLILDKVHRSMRYEFFSVLIGVVAAVVALLLLDLQGLISSLLWLALFVYAVVILVYGIRFFRFYRHTARMALDSYENLLWLYYELRLMIEVYRSFTLTSMLIGLSFGFIVGSIEGSKAAPMELADPDSFIWWLMLTLTVSFAALLGIIEWWIYYAYGRSLRRIKLVLSELKEGEGE
jgi:hypothetical protein